MFDIYLIEARKKPCETLFMNKFITVFATFAAFFLFGCSNFTQEMKENVSFVNLKKVYVQQPEGLGAAFATNAAEINSQTRQAVAEFLKSKDFTPVEKPEEAQIIFRPLWNTSLAAAESLDNQPISMQASKPLSIGFSQPAAYATLEIQAVLPKSGDIWSWRGFSPINMTSQNATVGLIKDQVAWCLQYFPPEDYPSALEEYKKKKETVDAQAAQNPFNEVLIKEREKREKAQ